MANVGEEIVGAYLKDIEKCDLVQYNIRTIRQQELDVVGINLKEKKVFFCEVATHVTGLQYVKDRRPNNVEAITKKFLADIEYANKYFSDFKKVFMLWSPIVKTAGEKAKFNAINDVRDIQNNIKIKFGINIEMIINEEYLKRFNLLRNYAASITKNPEMMATRFLQIEERLIKHVKKITR